MLIAQLREWRSNMVIYATEAAAQAAAASLSSDRASPGFYAWLSRAGWTVTQFPFPGYPPFDAVPLEDRMSESGPSCL
jgi:hypothetical protein